MTKEEILECIRQNGPHMTLVNAEAIYSAIVACVAGELHNTKTSILPGLVKLEVRAVPARPACTKVIAGKSYDLEAKPASKTVKAKVLKALIDQV